MKRLLRECDAHNYYTCRYTQKPIRIGQPFYSEMVQRQSGHGWRRTWAVSIVEGDRMVAVEEAKVVTWGDLGEEIR